MEVVAVKRLRMAVLGVAVLVAVGMLAVVGWVGVSQHAGLDRVVPATTDVTTP
jgi:hypothetical protein